MTHSPAWVLQPTDCSLHRLGKTATQCKQDLHFPKMLFSQARDRGRVLKRTEGAAVMAFGLADATQERDLRA